jgi:hypothetical protein
MTSLLTRIPTDKTKVRQSRKFGVGILPAPIVVTEVVCRKLPTGPSEWDQNYATAYDLVRSGESPAMDATRPGWDEGIQTAYYHEVLDEENDSAWIAQQHGAGCY